MGSYVISVSAGTGCYRHIQISQGATLFRLHRAILAAFDFEDDHAHAFFMDNHCWSRNNAFFSMKMNGRERLTIVGKPARNAPCPCGSGRKYKNCCGKG